MDKVCKKVLERMHQDGPPEQFAFWLFDGAMKLEAEACGLSVEELGNALRYLIENGWAEYVFSRDNHRSGVKLTHKGVHYKEFIWRDRMSRILIPAAVSVATSIIVDCIKWLLPLLLQ